MSVSSFRRIRGHSEVATHTLESRLSDICADIRSVDQEITAVIDDQKDRLAAAYEKLRTYSTNFDVRKLAACTKQDDHTFYILCGWMSQSDAKAFQEEVSPG